MNTFILVPISMQVGPSRTATVCSWSSATAPVDRAAKAMLRKYDASDEEILAYYREHHNPYITLESAKKHWCYSMRWWHLATVEEARRQAEEQERGDRLREKLWPSAKSTPVPAPRVIPRLRIAARYARGIAKGRP